MRVTHLGHGVELDHGFSEWISIGTEVGYKAEHGSVEGAIDLPEGGGCWVVNIDHWDMTKESGRYVCVCVLENENKL